MNAKLRRYAVSFLSEPAEPTGVGIYGIELVRAMAPLLAPGERLAILRHADFPAPLPGGAPRIEDMPLRFPAGRSALRRAAEQALLPLAAARRRAALIHALNHVAPLLARAPVVVTLHDTRLFETRGEADLARRLFRRVAYPLSLRRAARLVADSAWTADRVARTFGIDRARIAVIPLGVDVSAARTAPEDRARIRARVGIAGDGPAIVFVGAFLPNKNLPRLLDAFAALAARPEGRGATLVLAGGGRASGSEREAAALGARARALGIEERVRFPGYLDRGDLLGLVALASALAFPSLEEGFGMPVLEAFALGTPVLASDRGALPEVAEGAALAVDPEDPAAIAEGLARLIRDPGLRAELVARGRRRAAEFSWARTAASTLEVYRSLATNCERPARPVEFS